MSDLTKRFSEDARRALQTAMTLAGEWGHTYVGSEHLLVGILSVCSGKGGGAAKLLREKGVTDEELKKRIVGIVGTGNRCAVTSEDLTPTCRRILTRASQYARGNRSAPVGAEQLLIALFKEECVGRRLAENCGADPGELVEILEELYGKSGGEPLRAEPERVRRSTPLLDKNAVDLTEKALAGRTDPVIGREAEEEQIIGILLRRTKNNPCLVGEAGVGKTAVVESVAARIASGRVPDALLGKRIMSLELSSVVAGTKYRGEFEEKIRGILDEAKGADDVILFIDEIHTIVGAGAAEGAIDASNILKPPLARGELKLIGATTQKEYKRCIEKDAALERRFRRVTVKEPDPEACKRILRGLQPRYEGFHGVRLTDDALEAAVTLSERYIGDRCLPDKAIDLIDEAAARKRMRGGRTVTAGDVAEAIRDRTGLDPDCGADAGEPVCGRLEKALRARIVGQDEALEQVLSGLLCADSMLRGGGKPLRSFLFLGPSGVGKTETARIIAETMFGKDAILKLDMTEYAEPHSVAKLIGAPPGYAGYGEGGLLTERMRARPHSLVLFDEVEKAHPDVRALLLQILDDGALTDSAGCSVSFRNSVVVLTANAGKAACGIGFSAGAETERASARLRAEELLSRELADRVDDTVLFRPLSADSLARIAGLCAGELTERLKGKGVEVRFDPEFLSEIVSRSQRENAGGAREIRRRVSRSAEKLLAEGLRDGRIPENSAVTLCSGADGFRMEIAGAFPEDAARLPAAEGSFPGLSAPVGNCPEQGFAF